MVESSEVLRARSRYAILTRHRPDNDQERMEAARDYRALSLEQHIQRVVAEAPPFTDEQRDRLRVLLAPGVVRHATRPVTSDVEWSTDRATLKAEIA
jgi:hypothetical protein